MMQLSDEEWKKRLSPEQYKVLREKGTEVPFSGELLNETGTGNFVCGACGNLLFKSDTKYESTIPGLMGWPSFADVAGSDAVELSDDDRHGMHRIEVTCKNCGSHLGHLFDDNTAPTGKHYCINSASLQFQPDSPDK